MDRYELLSGYDEVLKPKDVQMILHVGRNTVYKLIDEGKIKAIKIGNTYRIPKMNLADYLYPVEIPF